MRLLRLRVTDFRNLAEVDLEPSPSATILLGENGQGKTNLLEAITLLTTLKPLRAARLQDLVRFGAERARVAGDFDGPGGVRRAAVVLLFVAVARVDPGDVHRSAGDLDRRNPRRGAAPRAELPRGAPTRAMVGGVSSHDLRET